MQRLYELWPDILFWSLATTTVVSSIAVVVTQNIVRAAVWLLFALSGTAGLFFMLGADFVGATQLLIYVGGTLILVIFGVMLTARGPFVHMETGSGEWTLAAVVGLALFGLLSVSLSGADWKRVNSKDLPINEGNAPSTVQLGLLFLGIPPQAGDENPTMKVLRDPAGIGYLLPFEIVSVHLLVVLIGAAYLARAKRRRTSTL